MFPTPTMAAQLGLRRMVVTSAGIGVSAGFVGTWFEMSHGMVCIPVMSLPPLGLPQQVAIGTTVFGVAVRQALAAGLAAVDPNSGMADMDKLEQVIDVNAAFTLASSGTAVALFASSYAQRLGQRHLRKANGAFMIAVAIFMRWRDQEVKRAEKEAEQEPAPVVLSLQASLPTAPVQSAASDMPRLFMLGAASGVVLGLFGIGPAWIVAPILTASDSRHAIQGDHDRQIGTSGTDKRTQQTCCLAMVPPSLAAAWRHLALGHVHNPGGVALPLALGAIAGSAFGGSQLGDVPCDEEYKFGLSILFFAYGCWSLIR